MIASALKVPQAVPKAMARLAYQLTGRSASDATNPASSDFPAIDHLS
jgi:hypothetical protein